LARDMTIETIFVAPPLPILIEALSVTSTRAAILSVSYCVSVPKRLLSADLSIVNWTIFKQLTSAIGAESKLTICHKAVPTVPSYYSAITSNPH
jgi:predicted neutral ceramidase superfamily lipid hydrolase